MKKSKIPIGLKLPPYFDVPHFQSAAEIINKYKSVISYVASINTIGNALSVDYKTEMVSELLFGGRVDRVGFYFGFMFFFSRFPKLIV